MSSTVLSAVRHAYSAGLALLPVKSDGSKAPDTSAWAEFKTTRPTPDQMRAWDFAMRDGFGLIAGDVSGRIDPWDFDDEATFLAFLTVAHACGLGDVVDRIRHGYEDETPKRGRRWLVRYPAGATFAARVLAARPPRPDESPTPAKRPDIELTTFSILAPSNGPTHPSGRPYTRVSGGFGSIAEYTLEERESLFELARSFDQMPRRTVYASSGGSTPGGTERPGDRYNASASWPQILEPHGWTQGYNRDDETYWRRPGKTHGVSASTNYNGSDSLFVFTSSTVFESGCSYSKFGAYAVLEHGGDYARAARALVAHGYGDPDPDAASDRKSRASDCSKTSNGPRRLDVTPATDIAIRPVQWLWENRLSLGSLSLLGGREGSGKSLLAYQLAADLSRGRLPGVYAGTPRSVLVVATEDSWSHTIGPRLIAAQADRSRIYRIEATAQDGHPLGVSLPHDVKALEQIARDNEAALVILDPLLSRLDSGLDTHRDAEVRRALEPLAAMADIAHVTVLGLIHVNKSASADALNLLMASRAFPAVARNVLFTLLDPDHEGQRCLGLAKNNLGRSDLPVLVFEIINTLAAHTAQGPVWTGQVRWLAPSDRTLRDLIERAATIRTTDRTVVHDAVAWLEDFLATQGGTAAAAAVLRRGHDAGHSKNSLYHAKGTLKLVSHYAGFPRAAFWQLPGDVEPHSSCPSPESPEPLGTTGDLSSPETGGTTGTTGTTEAVPVAPSYGTPTTGTAGPLRPGRCVDCDRPVTHPRAGERCAECRRARRREADQ